MELFTKLVMFFQFGWSEYNATPQQKMEKCNNHRALKTPIFHQKTRGMEIGPQVKNNNDSVKKEGGCINARGNE